MSLDLSAEKKEKGLAGRRTTKSSSEKIDDNNRVKYTKEYLESRKSELQEIFNAIKADLQEQADYFSPNSVRFIARNVNKPRIRSKKILDSTTLTAVRNFAAGMMTGATSPTRRWFKTSIFNKDLAQDWEVKDFCAKQAELTRRILYASNFYQLLPEVYDQMAVFLFSALAMESDYDTVVNFKCLPIGSYYYSKDNRGIINTFCRRYMESARNLIKEFGYENCSDAVQEASKVRPNEIFEIVHYVEPNFEHVSGSPFSAQKKFISIYYEANSNNNNFLRKSGFDRFPYVVFEASCNGEDNYPSKGLGAYALPDAKQLMTMVKEYAKAVKKMVSPPYNAPASLKNKNLSDTPAYFNELDENGNGLKPVFEVNPRILELKESINEIRENIKSIFYNDLFAMILNTAERGRTATEVNELKEEKMVLLSPLLEQIHIALRQILDWLFYEELDKGILPPIPDVLQGQEIETEFVSTLAQAMKAQNIASMERFTTFVANMGQTIDPVLLKKINGEQMIDDYADFANIDPSQVTPSKEIAAIRAAMEQKQQQQEQMQTLTQGSQLVKNMGGVDAFGGELMQRLGQG